MYLAYALIVAEPGASCSVAAAFRTLPETVAVDTLDGPYDLVVKIQVLNEDGLLRFIRERTGAIEGIRSTTTLVAARSA